MKKMIALALVLAMMMALALVACGDTGSKKVDPNAKSEGVMTYAEYIRTFLIHVGLRKMVTRLTWPTLPSV